MSKDYGTFADAMKDRDFKAKLQREGYDVDLIAARINAGASIRGALISADASRYGYRLGVESDRLRFNTEVASTVRELTSKGGANYLPYRQAVAAGTGSQYLQDLTAALGGGNDPAGLR
jgi:hypothetical protein